MPFSKSVASPLQVSWWYHLLQDTYPLYVYQFQIFVTVYNKQLYSLVQGHVWEAECTPDRSPP